MRLNSFVLPIFIGAGVFAISGCAGDSSANGKDKADAGDSAYVDDYVQPEDNDGDGSTPDDGDCDDDNPDEYPARVEDCDGVDNNCNGVVDEGLPDNDEDGVPNCRDAESCDGIDNDGDTYVDEGFPDDNGNGIADCIGAELCDGVDNNQDGQTDEGFDVDGDGYLQCDLDGRAADCDDDNADIFPDAGEVDGDGVDNDCNGLADEGAWSYGDLVVTEILQNPLALLDPEGEWFEVLNVSGRDLDLRGLTFSSDADGDWFQVSANAPISLAADARMVLGPNPEWFSNGNVTVGYGYNAHDMLLTNESDEILIFADDLLIDAVVWDDGETMPDPSGASMTLDSSLSDADSNDDASAWCVATAPWTDKLEADLGSPGEENELCPAFDHDGDGISGAAGDCDDTDASVYPGAPEVAPYVDNDCDGEIESAPVASASYSSSSSTLLTCSPLYLDGSGSFDYEGATLSYSWTLASAPGGSARSTSDIVNTTDVNPTFTPDIAGDYSFQLIVNDGGLSSAASTFTVAIADGGC